MTAAGSLLLAALGAPRPAPGAAVPQAGGGAEGDDASFAAALACELLGATGAEAAPDAATDAVDPPADASPPDRAQATPSADTLASALLAALAQPLVRPGTTQVPADAAATAGAGVAPASPPPLPLVSPGPVQEEEMGAQDAAAAASPPPAAAGAARAAEGSTVAAATAAAPAEDEIARVDSLGGTNAAPTAGRSLRKGAGRAAPVAGRAEPVAGPAEPGARLESGGGTTAASAAPAGAARSATAPAPDSPVTIGPATQEVDRDGRSGATPARVASDVEKEPRRERGEASADTATGLRPIEAPAVRSADAASPHAVAAPSIELVHRTQQAAATPAAPPPVPVEAVPGHVEWLAARGGGSARLRLDPPHLGPIDVSVSVRGERVEVVFTAHEAATPELVHGQREALGAALAARDLRLDHFEVRGATGADGAPGRTPDGDLARQGGGAPYQDPQQAPERRPDSRGAGAGSPVASLRGFDVARAAHAPATAHHRIDLRV